MPCSDCSPAFTALPKLKQCKLLSRSRSNQAAIEQTEFSELLSHAEKELVKYGQAIAKLHELIIALENNREDLNCQLGLAKSLLAPIRKLPPEILREIFIAHGVSNDLVPYPGETTIPGYRLASVCAHWRSVAIGTTALWSNICVEIGNTQPPPAHADLVKDLLRLSAKSKLDITIYASTHECTTPACFVSLCEQANRWESLAGTMVAEDILNTLSSVQGRLKTLKTCTVLASFKNCSAWIEGAQELRKAAIYDIDPSGIKTAAPWNQIVDLELHRAYPPRIVESLTHLRNLRFLRVTHPCWRQHQNSVHQQPVQSNLHSLTLRIEDGEHEFQMTKLLDMLILPKLEFLSVISLEYKTNQGDISWSSKELPSLISRSSASITSFSLDRAWVPTDHLIALLKSMPSLTFLFLREPSQHNSGISPMVKNQLLSHIHPSQNWQPILTRLTSLTLQGCQLASDFSIALFVKVIQRRWKPSTDEVACIKTVKLAVVDGSVPRKDVQSLVMLRARGLDISIKDRDGEVPLWEDVLSGLPLSRIVA